MSSPNSWLRPDRSRGTGALLPAHMLVITRYGPKRLTATMSDKFTIWGLLTVSHILQALCLELGLLGPMWRTFVIGCIHWMNQCKGSSRRPIGGTWSCRSDTKRIRNSGCSICSLWSRRWWPCIATSSRCRVTVHRPVHNLHHTASTHSETTTIFWILTMISIRSF